MVIAIEVLSAQPFDECQGIADANRGVDRPPPLRGDELCQAVRITSPLYTSRRQTNISWTTTSADFRVKKAITSA
jgi:hypothetical protein